MSFIIAVHVNEGIVLASDRRTTYNQFSDEQGKEVIKIGVHTNDTTDKTFKCLNGCGISTCGDASLLGKPITGYIQEFIHEKISKDTKTSSVPQMLIDYFQLFPQKPNTNFLIAGYEKENDKYFQKVYKVLIYNNEIIQLETINQGATWDGESSTLMRLLHKCIVIPENGTATEFPKTEILFEYFTLQDAVDFARYAIETTIKSMHFQNMIETVGGDIDILIIKPNETKWLQKEDLH